MALMELDPQHLAARLKTLTAIKTLLRCREIVPAIEQAPEPMAMMPSGAPTKRVVLPTGLQHADGGGGSSLKRPASAQPCRPTA